MLAAEVIRAQGIDVLALFFETPFFGSSRARKSARGMGLPLKVVDITRRHLEVVRRPKHGYGSHLNPCVDCHALMFRIAGEMLASEGCAFVFTGEVLGQRPMSQNKGSLNRIAKESGLGGLLVRPLSAKRLAPTIPEENGWIQREALLDLQGRSRKPQIEMARQRNITDYPSPAGGCLLTEKGFSRRLKDLFETRTEIETRELELLKFGRHFRLSPQAKLVVGRNKRENEIIRSLAGEDDITLKSVSAPGPTALLSGDPSEELLLLAAGITASYSDTSNQEISDISVGTPEDEQEGEAGAGQVWSISVHDKREFKRHLI